MQFYITPRIEGKATRLKVDRIFQSEEIERFEVTAKNKTLTLQTNRLLFLNRGLKHRKGQWTLISGNLTKQSALDNIIKAIEDKL